MTRRPRLEDEIVHILKEVRSGKTVADVCRAYGVSGEVVGCWLGEYRGLDQFEIGRLMERDAEIGRSGRTRPVGR